MKLTREAARQITPLLRAAVQLQIACWRFQSQIERKLGIDFKNLEQGIADLAAAGDPEAIDDQEAQAFIEGLDIEAYQYENTRRLKEAAHGVNQE